jgi:hypothetical protein
MPRIFLKNNGPCHSYCFHKFKLRLVFHTSYFFRAHYVSEYSFTAGDKVVLH